MGTRPQHHDACGVGFVADLEARPGVQVLPLALEALGRLAHRGAIDADGRTGDGAGVLTEVPHALCARALADAGTEVPAPGDLGVGLLFLPRDAERAGEARGAVAAALAGRGLRCLAFRAVPIREEALGAKARRSRPELVHVLVGRPAGIHGDAFERALFLARRDMERALSHLSAEEFYVASLSHRTLVYKALVRGVDLREFYDDLRDPEYRTSFALFHQRYSTNTLPSWSLTQPFRVLAHNGEINTIRGNRRWMRARAAGLRSARLRIGEGGLDRVLREGRSDSASLDEAVDLLLRAGREIDHSIAMLMPPAWESDAEMPDDVRAFFDFHSCLVEPWDGPAMVAFADGRLVGAALDRNGLRPARYVVTADGLVVLSSEAGVVDVPGEKIVSRGRLGSGDIVVVDLRARRLLDRDAIHRRLAARRPYGAWLDARRRLDPVSEEPSHGRRARGTPSAGALKAFGYTREELQLVLRPMYRSGAEPIGSMGDDTALSVLSLRPRLLFSYFKQHFAQVTNPPIDPLRESLVMSLGTHVGPRGNLLEESADCAAQAHLPSPLLTEAQLAALVDRELGPSRSRTLSLLFSTTGDTRSFRQAVDRLLEEAARAVAEGVALVVLSDRGLDAGRAALPSLLAVSAVHQHLV
ncbi:MAG TPA: glutamate synthase central domain-containing protein, partial [Vicinamibacteria bacterium]